MRKTISIFLCCALAFIMCGIDVHGASTPVIYGDITHLEKGAAVKLPVYIKSNTGIMGFHIKLRYDSDEIEISDVSSGELTESGLFNNNLHAKAGRLDVIWSGSEEIKENGLLFYITAKAEKKYAGKSEIKLTSFPEETFDEDFQTVKISCRNIQLTDEEASPGQPADPDAEESYLAKEISDEITTLMNDKQTSDIIKNVLEEEGVQDIRETNAKQRKDILKKIVHELNLQGIDTTRLNQLLKDAHSEGIDTNTVYAKAVQTVDQQIRSNSDQTKASIDVDKAVKHTFGIRVLVILIICLTIAAGILVAIIYRRRNTRRN